MSLNDPVIIDRVEIKGGKNAGIWYQLVKGREVLFDPADRDVYYQWRNPQDASDWCKKHYGINPAIELGNVRNVIQDTKKYGDDPSDQRVQKRLL